LIKLENVWYMYPNGITALRDVTLEFSSSIMVIVGPNGSGKTTLLKVMALLYRPMKGKVMVDGVNYWSLNEKDKLVIRRNVVYVHEKPILLRRTVLENVAYGLLIRGTPKQLALKKALEILEEFDMKHIAHRRVRELSAGEAHIACIARALLLKPKYLLLDEPTANLDLQRRQSLLKIIEDYVRNGIHVAIATNDHSLVNIAKQVVIVDRGRVLTKANN